MWHLAPAPVPGDRKHGERVVREGPSNNGVVGEPSSSSGAKHASHSAVFGTERSSSTGAMASSSSLHDVPANQSKSGANGAGSSTTEKAASDQGRSIINSVVDGSNGTTFAATSPSDEDSEVSVGVNSNPACTVNGRKVVAGPAAGSGSIENGTVEESLVGGEEPMLTTASRDTRRETVKAPDSVRVSDSERQPENPCKRSLPDHETRGNKSDGIGTPAELPPENRSVAAATATSHGVREGEHEDIMSDTKPETGIPHPNNDRGEEGTLGVPDVCRLSSHIASTQESESSIVDVQLERKMICSVDAAAFRNDAAAGDENEPATVAPVKKGAAGAAANAGVDKLRQQQQRGDDPECGVSRIVLPENASNGDNISTEQRPIHVQGDNNPYDGAIGEKTADPRAAEEIAAARSRACESSNPTSGGVRIFHTEKNDISSRVSPFTTAATTADAASAKRSNDDVEPQSGSNGLVQTRTSNLRTASASNGKTSQHETDNISEAMWRGQPVNISDIARVTLYKARGKLIARQHGGSDRVTVQQEWGKMCKKAQPRPKSENEETRFRRDSNHSDGTGAQLSSTSGKRIQGNSDNKKVGYVGRNRCRQQQYCVDVTTDNEREGRKGAHSVLIEREPREGRKTNESKQEALPGPEPEMKAAESSDGVPSKRGGCTQRRGDRLLATADRMRYKTRPEFFQADPYLGPPVAAGFPRAWPDSENVIVMPDSSISGAKGAKSCRRCRRHVSGNPRKSRGDDGPRHGVKGRKDSASESKGSSDSISSSASGSASTGTSSGLEDSKGVYVARGSERTRESTRSLARRRSGSANRADRK